MVTWEQKSAKQTGRQGQESETRGKQGQTEEGQRWVRDRTEVSQGRGSEV